MGGGGGSSVLAESFYGVKMVGNVYNIFLRFSLVII